MQNSKALLAFLVASCVMAAGCSTPVGRYFARRGADLADCVHAEVGLGWPFAPFLFPKASGYAMDDPGGTPIARGPDAPPRRSKWRSLMLPHLYLRFKLTDFFVFSSGYAEPVSTGIRGRYRPSGHALAFAVGLPVYRNIEEGAGTAVRTDWTVLTHRTYDAGPPGPGGRVAEAAWTGFSATMLVAFRLDFNLVEFADFLAGWFGYDLLGDDDWAAGEEER